MGVTNVGKSSMAKAFAKDLGYAHFHCIAPFKRHIEQIFNLKPGQLDTQKGKHQQLPGAPKGVTYQDMMVKYFHFWSELGGAYGAESTRYQILESTESTIMFDSIRNPTEVEMLLELVESGKIRIDIIHLTAKFGKEETSDIHLEGNIERLRAVCRHYLKFDNFEPLEQAALQLNINYLELFQ